MSWKTNIIFLIILILLGGFYYFYEIKGEKQREEAKYEAERLLPGVKPDSIQYLSLERIAAAPDLGVVDGGVKFEFRRDRDRWMISFPISAAADSDYLKMLISDLVQLKSEKKLMDKAEDLNVFGLNNPGFIIKISGLDEKSQPIDHVFKLGDENPTGKFFYIMCNKSEEIFLASNSIKQKLIKPLDDYRDKKIADIKSADVKKLEYQLKNTRLVTVESQDDEWRLVAPNDTPGDRARIEELVNALQNTKAKQFVSETRATGNNYGFDSPLLSITIWSKSSDAIQRLIVGDYADEGKKFRFAYREGFEPVFTVAEDFVTKFDGDPFTLSSKDVCKFEREAVKKIRWESERGIFTVELSPDMKWRLAEPRSLPADDEDVGAFLSDLAFLKASAIRFDPVEFSEKNGMIQLFGASKDTPLMELTIGMKSEDGIGYWVKSGNQAAIYKMTEQDVEKLMKTEFQLRNKEVTNFDKSDVKKLTIKTQKAEISFKPSGDDYKILSPEGATVETVKLDDIFWSVNRLKMKSIENEDASDLEMYGLTAPRFIITAQLSDKLQGPVRVGLEDPEKRIYFAAMKDSSLVFGLDSQIIKGLEKLDFEKEIKN